MAQTYTHWARHRKVEWGWELKKDVEEQEKKAKKKHLSKKSYDAVKIFLNTQGR